MARATLIEIRIRHSQLPSPTLNPVAQHHAVPSRAEPSPFQRRAISRRSKSCLLANARSITAIRHHPTDGMKEGLSNHALT